MNTKMKLKIITDMLMTLLLLFLMGYHLWSEAAHEWAGAALLILFLAHNLLNRNWYRGLCKGTYSAMRIIQTLLNFLLLVCMAMLMYSGIVLSRYVFPVLQAPGSLSAARLMHMATAYWGIVLMALHLGLHWNMLFGMLRNRIGGAASSGAGRMLFPLCGTAIAAYGLAALLRRDLLTYMLVRTEFVFLDYGESKLWFYVDYLAIMGLFVFLAHYGARLVRRIQSSRKEKKMVETGGEKTRANACNQGGI